MNNRNRNFTLAAFLAAGIGYVTGILTAPKSGKETRNDIQNAAVRAKKDAEKRLKQIHGELTELIDRGSSRAKSTKSQIESELSDLLEKASDARDKVRHTLSSIHEGGADDKDLQKAITETSKATEHLRKYLERQADEKSK